MLWECISSGREIGTPAMCLAIEFDVSNPSHCAKVNITDEEGGMK